MTPTPDALRATSRRHPLADRRSRIRGSRSLMLVRVPGTVLRRAHVLAATAGASRSRVPTRPVRSASAQSGRPLRSAWRSGRLPVVGRRCAVRRSSARCADRAVHSGHAGCRSPPGGSADGCRRRRQSHAAGVDHEAAVVELADARLVRVPAQDQRGLHLRRRARMRLVMRGGAHAARAVAAEIRRHGLEEIAQVVVRRAVAAEHVAGRTHAWPAASRASRGAPRSGAGGMAVGRAHAFERTQHLALVVAADRGQGKRHQAVGRLAQATAGPRRCRRG